MIVFKSIYLSLSLTPPSHLSLIPSSLSLHPSSPSHTSLLFSLVLLLSYSYISIPTYLPDSTYQCLPINSLLPTSTWLCQPIYIHLPNSNTTLPNCVRSRSRYWSFNNLSTKRSFWWLLVFWNITNEGQDFLTKTEQLYFPNLFFI